MVGALSNAASTRISRRCSGICSPATRSNGLCLAKPWRAQRIHNRSDLLVVNSAVYQSQLRIEGMQVTSPKAWRIIADTLRENQVKLISQQELLFEKEKGAIIVDIRPVGEYETGHIKDSVNVSLFRLITGWDPVKALRRAGFAFFGVFNGTEFNPDFETQIFDVPTIGSREAKEEVSLVLICHSGGTLEPSQSYKNGKQSRSLIAAYQMLKLGFKKVSVLKGGFYDWRKNERPFEVSDAANES